MLPPIPRPRTSRPGGYPATQPSPFDFLKGTGGDLIGNALSDLGAGIAQGGFQNGFGIAAQRGQDLQPMREQQNAARKTVEETKQQTNATIAWLQQKHPDLAAAVQTGGLPVATAFSEAFKREQPGTAADPSKTPAGRATLADQYGLQGDDKTRFILTGDLPGGNASTRYGNAPVMVTDGKGNWKAIQPGTDGSTNEMSFPDGYHPDPGGLNAERAGGTAFGTQQGGAQFNLPAAKVNVETELSNIAQLRSDTQGIEETFGKVAGVWPQQWSPMIPGTKRADYAARLDQVVGQNFLQAYSSLRGAGAITEAEGMKAQDAMGRLSKAQSKEAYLAALDDLEAVLKIGYDRMAQQATTTYQNPSNFNVAPIGQPVDLGNGVSIRQIE